VGTDNHQELAVQDTTKNPTPAKGHESLASSGSADREVLEACCERLERCCLPLKFLPQPQPGEGKAAVRANGIANKYFKDQDTQ
jgi:hypothetical protein